MNIFDIYLDKIIKIVTDQNKKDLLKLPKKLDSINVDIPPKQFDCDISTNVSMVLSKINETQPIELANKLVLLIKKEDSNIDSIKVVKPGFINIKFKQSFWNAQNIYNATIRFRKTSSFVTDKLSSVNSIGFDAATYVYN